MEIDFEQQMNQADAFMADARDAIKDGDYQHASADYERAKSACASAESLFR